MRYKIAKPEDFTDVQGYGFKLSGAYSSLYCDLLSALANIDMAIEVLRGEDDKDLSCEIVANVLERFIDNFKIK